MDEALQRDICLDLVQEVIARGGEIPIQASGLSMGHTLLSGEWILVQRVDPAHIRTGDIVLYRIPSTFVAHRVIRRWLDRGEPSFLTKGDGLVAPDKPLRGADIIARVIGVRRDSGELRFDTPRGCVLTRLLLWHSLAAWRLARFFRPAPRPRSRPGPLRRGLYALLMLPQDLLGKLWYRDRRRP
jgi:hypothetical protein